jgi:hypothetical protein
MQCSSANPFKSTSLPLEPHRATVVPAIEDSSLPPAYRLDGKWGKQKHPSYSEKHAATHKRQGSPAFNHVCSDWRRNGRTTGQINEPNSGVNVEKYNDTQNDYFFISGPRSRDIRLSSISMM